MSSKKRIISNGFASLLQKIIKVAEQLLLIPFFIKFWGTEYYGEWLTLTIIPQFLAISDFGFGTATANTFLLKYVSGEKIQAAITVKTGIKVLTFAILIIIILSGVTLSILTALGILSHSIINSNEVIISIMILLTARILTFYNGIFEAYYRAARKAHQSIFLQSIYSLILIIFGLIILFFGGKVVSYSLSVFIATIIFNPIYIWIAIKELKFKEYKLAKFDKNLAKELFNKGLGYFLSPIWQAIYFQGTTFVIRILLGATAVTIFNTMRTLVRSSSQIFGFIITSIYPEFQFEVGKNNLNRIKKLFLTMLTLNILIGIFSVLFLLTFGLDVYSLWTQNKINLDYKIWSIFISSIMFYAIWFTYSFIFEAYNKPYELTISGLITAIISVITVYLLVNKFGIIGGAFGMLTFDVLMVIILLKRSHSYLKITISDFTKQLSEATKLIKSKIYGNH